MAHEVDVLLVSHVVVGCRQLVLPPVAVAYYEQLDIFFRVSVAEEVVCQEYVGKVLAPRYCTYIYKVAFTVTIFLSGSLFFLLCAWMVVVVRAVIYDINLLFVNAVELCYVFF